MTDASLRDLEGCLRALDRFADDHDHVLGVHATPCPSGSTAPDIRRTRKPHPATTVMVRHGGGQFIAQPGAMRTASSVHSRRWSGLRRDSSRSAIERSNAMPGLGVPELPHETFIPMMFDVRR
jgi:hypothetical protein